MDLKDFFDNKSSVVETYRQNKLLGKVKYYDIEQFEEIIDYFYFNQQFKNALIAVFDAERIHPGNFEILLRKARVLIELKYYVSAIKIIEFLLTEDSSEQELYLLAGFSYASLNKYDRALRYFDRMVELAKSKFEKVEFLNDIGYILFSRQRYDLAYKYFARSHKIEPSDSIVMYEMAFCLEKMNRDKESREIYEVYLKSNPFSKLAWYNLGVVYTKLNDYDKAIEAFDYALAIDPKFSSAVYNKANLLYLKNDYKGSIAGYKRVLALENNNPSAYFFLARNYIALGKYNIALAYLKKSLEKVPVFPQAWFEIANIYYKINKTEKSKNFVLKAIRKGGSKPEYWRLLAEIYVKEKNFVKADKAYDMATSYAPYDDSLWFEYADSFEKNKNWQRSIEILKNGSGYINDKVKLNLKLAGLYFKLGDTHSATYYLEEARKINPELNISEHYPSVVDKKKKTIQNKQAVKH